MTFEPGVKLNEVKRFWVMHALYHSRWNKTQAAADLGITIKSIYNYLHEWGVPIKTADLVSWFYANYPQTDINRIPVIVNINAGALPRGKDL